MVETTAYAEVSTFIEIIPAGIVVFNFDEGLSQVSIGTQQSIDLLPSQYSYDIDGTQDISELNFKFYCQVIDGGVAKNYPSMFVGVYDDLLKFKEGLSNIPMYHNSTCFDSPNGFSFDATNNALTINPGYLIYYNQRIYEFWTVTTYRGDTYEQKVRISIENTASVPRVTIGCKFKPQCQPLAAYMLVNPTVKLIVQGDCSSGCDTTTTAISFAADKLFPKDGKELWLNLVNIDDLTVGRYNSKEFSLLTTFFDADVATKYYRISYQVTTALNITGKSSLQIKVNTIPGGGTCKSDIYSGYAPSTEFQLTCQNWFDADGQVTEYEFIVKYADKEVSLGVSYSGNMTTVLPIGDINNDYKLNITVKATDNDGGSNYFQIVTQFRVLPDEEVIKMYMDQVNNLGTLKLEVLYSGLPQAILQSFLSISSVLNQWAVEDLAKYEKEPFYNETANVTVIEMTSEEYEAKRNERSKLRDSMIDSVNNVTIGEFSKMKSQADALSFLSGTPNEITRKSADRITNQILRMINELAYYKVFILIKILFEILILVLNIQKIEFRIRLSKI
jgi:hypothetical protein